MNEEFTSSKREDQFIDVLDKALKKIVNNLSADIISNCYEGVGSDDKLFIEIAANKLLDEYKEEAKTTLLQQCKEQGIFDYLNQLDSNDKELEEKKELADKYCGSVVDVNKLLAVQRMRIKKQVIKALEKQILADESEIHDLYSEIKGDMQKIQKGVNYLKHLQNSIV